MDVHDRKSHEALQVRNKWCKMNSANTGYHVARLAESTAFLNALHFSPPTRAEIPLKNGKCERKAKCMQEIVRHGLVVVSIALMAGCMARFLTTDDGTA
jgi:hypothetical protein